MFHCGPWRFWFQWFLFRKTVCSIVICVHGLQYWFFKKLQVFLDSFCFLPDFFFPVGSNDRIPYCIVKFYLIQTCDWSFNVTSRIYHSSQNLQVVVILMICYWDKSIDYQNKNPFIHFKSPYAQRPGHWWLVLTVVVSKRLFN